MATYDFGRAENRYGGAGDVRLLVQRTLHGAHPPETSATFFFIAEGYVRTRWSLRRI